MRRVYLTITHPGAATVDPAGLYRVDIVRTGKWDYPRPGEPGFEITRDIIRELADNFNAGILGREVPLNVDHPDDDGVPRSLKDCGWVKAVEVSPDGETLVGLIDVTEPGVKEKVDNGTLKYSSAELDFERVCPELSASGDDRPRIVLEGLALTNYPYVKRMSPVSPAVVLSDRAALDAAGVHYPSVMNGDGQKVCPWCGSRMSQAEADASYCDSCDRSTGGKAADASIVGAMPGGTMPEDTITLTQLQMENETLKARLADLEKNPDAKAALAEAKSLKADIALRDTEEAVRGLIRRGRATPAVGRRILRLAEAMIKADVAKITLTEPVTGRKYKLAETEEDAIDKLDVIKEVVDMFGELPDSMAMDPTQTRLADGASEGEDEDEELKKEADKIQASDKGLSRREAYKQARIALAERKGGR